jgi:hypothetical protein
MSISPLVTQAAETLSGVNPVVVGVGIFVLLMLCMLALLAFGGGRDHS